MSAYVSEKFRTSWCRSAPVGTSWKLLMMQWYKQNKNALAKANILLQDMKYFPENQYCTLQKIFTFFLTVQKNWERKALTD